MCLLQLSLHVTLSINILLLNAGNVHTHVCCLPSCFPLPAALCRSPGTWSHFRRISCQHKLLSLTATNASNPKGIAGVRSSTIMCMYLCIYVCIYIYMYIDMKQVTSMFHSFVTYMLRINPSRQPKTRWFTSLAPASSQLKVWTIPGTHWKEHANFCFQPLVQRAFHLTVTKRKDGI